MINYFGWLGDKQTNTHTQTHWHPIALEEGYFAALRLMSLSMLYVSNHLILIQGYEISLGFLRSIKSKKKCSSKNTLNKYLLKEQQSLFIVNII